MSKTKLMGTIKLGYDDVLLPLDVAHKVQALLAEHAVLVDKIYGSAANNHAQLRVTRTYATSPVEIFRDNIDFDASMVDSNTYHDWQGAIRDRAVGDVVMSPEDFAKLRGEQQ